MEIKYIGKCLLIEDKERILVIGDLHFGYDEVMRKNGINIPVSLFDETKKDIELILENTGKVGKIVLLGDLKHEFGSILKSEINDIIKILDYLLEFCKEIVIIKGNHDAITNSI